MPRETARFIAKVASPVLGHFGLFEPYGAIEKVTIIRDRESGRSRGFGFVEMTNESEAATAIAALNGNTIAGRKIIVGGNNLRT